MSRSLTVGRALLGLCSLAALAAAGSAVPVVLAAGDTTRFVEAWRAIGFATFAVLFAVLALRPHASRGLWAGVVANKLALTVVGALWAGQAAGASQAVAWDGALTVALVAAAVLTRAWTPSASSAQAATVAPAPAVAR